MNISRRGIYFLDIAFRQGLAPKTATERDCYRDNMEKEIRRAIVYLPAGKELYYSTSSQVTTAYKKAEKIEGEPDRLNVVVIEGKKMIAKAYIGVPYCLEIVIES